MADLPDLEMTMMQRALKQAQRAADLGEVPVGAVVYRLADGAVLAEAHNRRELDADPGAHAEMLAIRAAARARGAWRLNGCGIAVTLEPCPMCAGVLVNSRIDRLVYGAADPKMGCVDTLYQLCSDPRFNHRIDVTAGVLAEPCGQILTRFFQARRGKIKPPKPQPQL